MSCIICDSAAVQEINTALSRGDSLRQVEAAYSANKSSLSRHQRQCLTAARAQGEAAPDLARVVTLLSDIKDLLEQLVQQRDGAAESTVPVAPASAWNRL